MKGLKRPLVAVALMLVTVSACAVQDIEAKDYDQSCAKDDDCVRVSELHAKGTDCSMECTPKAINKRDKAKYDDDLAEAQKSCGSMTSDFCGVGGVPACIQGRCEINPE